jgi:Putative mono-oxygenase ydhR
MIRASGVLIVLLTDAVRAMGPGRRKGEAMHAQVITFGLNGITEEQFREACGADAQTFANLPGLLAKIWLRNPETNTYGGL